MREERRRGRAKGDNVDRQEGMCCCTAWGFIRLLGLLYSVVGHVRLGFFIIRAIEKKLYSFPIYDHEFLISGIDMIIIGLFISLFRCCQSRAIFTLAIGLMLFVYAGSILAIALNFHLLTTFRQSDSYKIYVIRGLVPFSFFLHILLTMAITKMSCICGYGRNA
ncbi:unnamed protein product [Caenorhabditis sp. 36 PRJEB53466]|nr:unnamed protein product [Caenorhabditis sp. 36 PRJEB53466]